MTRLLLFLLLGYLLWRFLRTLFASFSQSQGRGRSQRTSPGRPETPVPRQYVDIKDAEFEDISTDKDTGPSE